MGGLALLSSLSGFYNYNLSNNSLFLYGAVTWATVFPFTYFVIKPLYTKLLKADEEKRNEGVEREIGEWVTMHRVRVLFGVVASALYLYAEAVGKGAVARVVVNTV
jgi:hypothetical protein